MKLLHIYALVQEFYALEAITAMLSKKKRNRFEPMRHSHSRWYRDFNDFRDEYISKFASAIFDYTALVVAAELRHCAGQASHFISEFYTSDQERDTVYHDCKIYNPYDILGAGVSLFDTSRVEWKRAFGGEKWRQIAKSGLMKGKHSDCIFIDHCIDLSHNNSVYFDKGAGIFYLHSTGEYRSFLDLKRSCEPRALIKVKQGERFNKLLWRAKNLGIFRIRPTKSSLPLIHDEAESLLFDYCPVIWGNKRLDYSESNIIAKNVYCHDVQDDRKYARCA